MHIIVMPAWIAGTQVRKDAFGNIHVSLDCSVPCWNDAMERFCFNCSNPASVFSKERRESTKFMTNKYPNSSWPS